MINEGLVSVRNTAALQRVRNSTELSGAENNRGRLWVPFAGLLHQTRDRGRVRDEPSPVQTRVQGGRNATDGIRSAALFIAGPDSEAQDEIADISL